MARYSNGGSQSGSSGRTSSKTVIRRSTAASRRRSGTSQYNSSAWLAEARTALGISNDNSQF